MEIGTNLMTILAILIIVGLPLLLLAYVARKISK
jgi:hypothetical protein